MNWYFCFVLPLPPGAHSCWFSGAFFAVEATSPEHADKLFRQSAGYGHEDVRTLVVQATIM